jgi:hypothetical protein
MTNYQIIEKDTYEVTGTECVFTDPYIDPDTGEFFWVLRGSENWEEI